MATLIRGLVSLFRNLDVHSQELLRGASVALILRIVGAGLTFLLSVILARVLGADGAGLYFLAFGVVSIAGVGARLGLGDALVRFTATGATGLEEPSLRSLAGRALTLGGVAGAVVTGVVLAVAPWLSNVIFDEPRLIGPLRIMILAVVPFVMSSLLAQLLRGRKRIARALAVTSALPPGLTCIGVLLLAPSGGARGAVLAYVIAVLVTLAVAVPWWLAAMPERSLGRRHFPIHTLLGSSMPLFWTSLAKMVMDRSPALFLGFFATAGAVGVLEVANRTALLVSFTLLAVNSIAGPKFAELYGEGDRQGLARAARRSAMLATLAAFPLVVGLVTVPETVMSLFGERFVDGSSLLVILSLGQLVNAGTGSVALVLVMTGRERVLRNIALVSLLASVVLYMSLVPAWGMHGAAVTYAITVSLSNLLAAFAVHRLLGIWVFPSPRALWRSLGREKAP